MNEISESNPKKKIFRHIFVESIFSSRSKYFLTIIGAFVGLLVNLISLKTLDFLRELPTTFFTLLYLAIALLIVLFIGILINRQQVRYRNRILTLLKITEDSLFLFLQSDLKELLELGEPYE